MGAKQWDQDDTGKTALWWTAYLRSECRGLGHAAELYKLRKEWTIRRGFVRAVFFILEGNHRSTEIHERHGARFMYSEAIPWPDRPTNTWRWYDKNLRAV